MPRMAVLLNGTKPAVPRDDTLQELGDFDSSNPIFVSQKMFLIIDLRSTFGCSEGRRYSSARWNVENIIVKNHLTKSNGPKGERCEKAVSWHSSNTLLIMFSGSRAPRYRAASTTYFSGCSFP